MTVAKKKKKTTDEPNEGKGYETKDKRQPNQTILNDEQAAWFYVMLKTGTFKGGMAPRLVESQDLCLPAYNRELARVQSENGQ